MTERYERHRQAWTNEEIQKLHMLVTKGMSLKAIAKALTRSEESTKNRAKLDKLKIQKMRWGLVLASAWLISYTDLSSMDKAGFHGIFYLAIWWIHL